jgi:hypothetical protein
MVQQDILHISADLKKHGDSPQKKHRAQTEIQLRRRELQEAREKESNGVSCNNVDLRVLLEDLYIEGDADEVSLLLWTREELESELVRRRNRNAVIE